MKNKLATDYAEEQVGKILYDTLDRVTQEQFILLIKMIEVLNSAKNIEQANIIAAFEEGVRYSKGLANFDSPATRYYSATYGDK